MSFSHHAHTSRAKMSGPNNYQVLNDPEPDEGINPPTETSTIVTNHGIISNVHRFSSPPLHSASVTKRRKVSANAVTPGSATKAIKNIYGTGPPRRGTMPRVSVQTRTSSNQVTPAEGPTNGPHISAATRTSSDTAVRFVNEVNSRVSNTVQVLDEVHNKVSKNQNQKEHSANYPKNSVYPFPGSYDEDLVIEKIEAHKNEQYEYIIWDPRGWDESFFATNPMPSSFCPHCRCPPLKCHAQLFGRYCQLHVVNDLYQMADQMTVKQAKLLFREKYNLALQMKIVEETGQLDIKLNGYNLPKCVEDKSLNESLDYVIGFRYHGRMHNGIVVGRGKPLRGHDKIFQHAMNDAPTTLRMNSSTPFGTTSNNSTTSKNVSNEEFIHEYTYDELKDRVDDPTDKTNSFYPLPGTNDAELVKEILEAHKNEHYEYIIWDPRGWDKTSSIPMPSSFCPHCRCPPLKCHAKLFGRYCQLHIVNDLYQSDDPINSIQAKELYRERYNIALQLKTVEETGQLDIKLNGYDLPRCVVEQSLNESMDYVNWYRYHVKMHKSIVVGQGREQYGHQKISTPTK
jgi:hypothetical protein